MDAARRDRLGHQGPGVTRSRCAAALDAQGNLVALDYDARAADYNHLGYNEPDTVLIAQLMGMRTRDAGARRRRDAVGHVRHPEPPHGRRTSSACRWCGRRRCAPATCAIPNGPQVTFASESFIDELAAAAKADPVEFRLKLLDGEHRATTAASSARARSPCVKAAAEAFGWDARPSPKPRGSGDILTGRGIAYAFRSQTVVAQIAEVEVNRRTGRVWVKRLVCAHDCGLVINPEALRRTIEGGMLHSLSRALHEEVQFDTEKVTSVDWVIASDADARRHAGDDRRRARERRSESEPARSAALRRRRDGLQADARGGRQRDLRRDRRAAAPRAVQKREACSPRSSQPMCEAYADIVDFMIIDC